MKTSIQKSLFLFLALAFMLFSLACSDLGSTASQTFTVDNLVMGKTYELGQQLNIQAKSEYTKGEVIGFTTSVKGEDKIRLSRLIALPGDVVVINSGKVRVNGELLEDLAGTAYRYKVIGNEPLEELLKGRSFTTGLNHFYGTSLTNAEAAELKADERVKMLSKDVLVRAKKDTRIWQTRKDARWNKDNWGPYTMAKEEFFVLSDDRSTAFDSRFLGPISSERIVGAVVSKDD